MKTIILTLTLLFTTLVTAQENKLDIFEAIDDYHHNELIQTNVENIVNNLNMIDSNNAYNEYLNETFKEKGIPLYMQYTNEVENASIDNSLNLIYSELDISPLETNSPIIIIPNINY